MFLCVALHLFAKEPVWRMENKEKSIIVLTLFENFRNNCFKTLLILCTQSFTVERHRGTCFTPNKVSAIENLIKSNLMQSDFNKYWLSQNLNFDKYTLAGTLQHCLNPVFFLSVSVSLKLIA